MIWNSAEKVTPYKILVNSRNIAAIVQLSDETLIYMRGDESPFVASDTIYEKFEADKIASMMELDTDVGHKMYINPSSFSAASSDGEESLVYLFGIEEGFSVNHSLNFINNQFLCKGN